MDFSCDCEKGSHMLIGTCPCDNIRKKHYLDKAVSTMNLDRINSGQMNNVTSSRKSSPKKAPSKTSKATGQQSSEPLDSVDLSGKTPTRFPFTTGNKVEPLTNSSDSLERIGELLSGAKDKIQVQMYRLGHDKIVDLLANQAKQGVKVQVLLDDSDGYDSKDAIKQAEMRENLKNAGVEVLRYPTGTKNRLAHVKMLIVDNSTLLIGGMNWDQHSPENVDHNVVVNGPVVGDAQKFYQEGWKLAGGTPMETIDEVPPAKDGDATVRMLTTEADHSDIRIALQDNIKGAKKSIYMEAFALSDKETIGNLKDAAGRGVDVRVILEPSKPMFFVNRKSAAELREAGVKVKWYDIDVDRREKLHAKLAMFDEETTFLGSANFSKMGLDVHKEANVEVISKSVGKAFNKMFMDHWDNNTLKETPNLPDFNERPPDRPTKEVLGRELYRYFTKNFNPSSTRVFAGKRRDMVVEAIDKFDKTDKPAPVRNLGAPEGTVPDEVEMETIGDLASFFGNIKDFKMYPTFEDGKTIYCARVEMSKKGYDLHTRVPQLMDDMVKDIGTKDIQDFVKKAMEHCPEGFLKAPAASSGRHHPADEVDPNMVDLSPNAEKQEYKGGGLVLHTRRVQVMAGKLCDHYGIEGREKDEILAAAVLHDMMKSVDMDEMKKAMKEGTEIPFEGHTRPNHGHVASEWIKMMDKSPGQKLTKNIAKYTQNHMAVWNKPEETPPTIKGEFIISMADYAVSQNEFYLSV